MNAKMKDVLLIAVIILLVSTIFGIDGIACALVFDIGLILYKSVRP